MVLRFIGFIYLVLPVAIVLTMILLALSVGWNGSQNAKISLLGHKLEAIVHSPIPLKRPCPQHATCDVTNPAYKPFRIVDHCSLV
jgi:hypothetical protein